MLFAYMEIIKYNKWFSTLFLIFFSIVMILFVGLRDGCSVGTDSPAYCYNYLVGYWNVEFGYMFLNTLFSQVLNVNYTIFLLFINSLSLILIARFIKLNSYVYLFPLLIYFSDFFLYYNFSGVRQAIALSFTCISLYHAMHLNYKKFFFFVICASLFHITAIVFAFAIFIPKNKLKLKDYVKFIGLSILVFLGIGYLIENVEYLNKKFIFYSEIQEVEDNIYAAYIVGILKRSIVILLALIFRKAFFNNDRFVYFFNLYLLGFIIFVSTYLISADFGVRFGSYYLILDTLLVGNMLYLSKKLHQKIVIIFIYSIVIIYKIYTYTILEPYQYKFIF